MDRLIIDLDRALFEVDRHAPCADQRFRMALGAPHDRLYTSDQLAAIKWLGEIVVSTETEAFDLFVGRRKTGQNQDRRYHPCGAQAAQHFISVDIGQHQVENDDVVIVQLTDFEPVLAQIGSVANIAIVEQDRFDALRHR